MDKTIVRFSIFGISLYFIYVMIMAYMGVTPNGMPFVLLLEYCFYILVKTQGQFHCQWARALALNIFLTEAFTYLDSIFNIIPDATTFLLSLSGMWVAAVGVTIYRGIKHFKRVKQLKIKRYGKQGNKN